jgi:ferredoxin
MATKIIADLCIFCGSCEENAGTPRKGGITTCPQGAITDGSDVGIDAFYIHPDKCNECVGHFGFEHCISVCPIEGCIIPDPDRVEDEPTLIKRALDMYPTDAELKARIESGNFPSLKRKVKVEDINAVEAVKDQTN